MFEPKTFPIIPRAAFAARVLWHTLLSLGIIAVSLGVGVLGYHFIERQGWVDALLNASMILGGMGPVGELHSTAGKVFASAYALFSGTVFLVAVAVMFAPVYHRFLHHFHLTYEDDEAQSPRP